MDINSFLAAGSNCISSPYDVHRAYAFGIICNGKAINLNFLRKRRKSSLTF